MFTRSSAVVLVMWLVSVGAVANAQEKKFDLIALQKLSFAGDVSNPKVLNENKVDKDAKPTGIEFGVIPKRMMTAQTWLNPVTNAVEQRIYPAILHPIPIIRAPHVRMLDKAPDLKTLALDIVQKDESEAELDPAKPFAIVSDDAGNVVLLSFSTITVPQDKVSEWKISGTIQPIKLIDHIADPVADRGRAVETKERLPLAGTIVFGKREDMMKPTTFLGVEVATEVATPREVARGVIEGRVASNGVVVDRVDMRTLRITDAKGKAIGEVKHENDDISDFTISPNGKYVAHSTERMVDVPNALPRREIATIVYGVNGKKITEVVGYDEAAFLPDGNLVVTGAGGEKGLFVTNLKAGKVTPIVFKDAPKETIEGREPDWWPRMPAVSPDGKWVAFVSGRDAYVVGVDGSGWTPVWLTPEHEPQTVPVFSPDSKYVAMVVTPLNVMTGPGEVVVFDLAKRVRQTIPAAKGAHSDIPLTWMP